MHPARASSFVHAVLAALGSAIALAAPAIAQCSNPWLPQGGFGTHGLDTAPSCLAMWDADGAGPQPEQLVLGGSFLAAGDLPTRGFAIFDPSTDVFATLGNAEYVTAIATASNGNLVVGGTFGASGHQVARWNGAAWTLLGAVGGGTVRALARLPNGDLVAGGTFLSIGGVACARTARWNGATWSPLGAGTDGEVKALTVRANGDLVAGGSFQSAGGGAAFHIATWNGASWSPLGAGCSNTVFALVTMPNGDVVAGGEFSSAGGVPTGGLARWNGATWSALGNPFDVFALAVAPNGDLVATGAFPTIGGIFCSRIARWNGTTWAPLGNGISGDGRAVAVTQSGEVLAGGAFASAGGVPAAFVARWDGLTWSALAKFFTDQPVTTATELTNGDLVVGGAFTLLQGATVRGLARWNGTGWLAFGDPDGAVTEVTRMGNGDVVAAGSFGNIGGIAATGIARWNGIGWSALGSGVTGVEALLPLPNGELIVGGSFTTAGGVPANGIARWNGTSWSAIGSGVGSVSALALRPNGDLVAASLASLSRWNGASWSSLGAFAAPVVGLATTPDGAVIAASGAFAFSQATPFVVSRWNGTNWQQLGAPFVDGYGFFPALHSVATLPDGDVVVAGAFGAMHTPTRSVARWNGSAWLVDVTAPRTVFALQSRPNGDLLVPARVGLLGQTSVLARLTTTCPALAAVAGAGCSGSAGPNVLTATSLPWIGASFTSTASGLATPSLAVEALGFSTASIALASILPQGLPGCSLLASPDLLTAVVPTAGSVALGFAIPDTTSLVGVSLRQQLVALELGATSSTVAATSTNALLLTIGAF